MDDSKRNGPRLSHPLHELKPILQGATIFIRSLRVQIMATVYIHPVEQRASGWQTATIRPNSHPIVIFIQKFLESKSEACNLNQKLVLLNKELPTKSQKSLIG